MLTAVDLGLAGRVALVTAASKGLGLASAMALAEEGAKVVICARGEEVLATPRPSWRPRPTCSPSPPT